MSINRDKPDLWIADIGRSVDLYNSWFMEFAPKVKMAEYVEFALRSTENLTNVTQALLKEHPRLLSMLRMSTCPLIARDRLVGLAGISKNLAESMVDAETPRVPRRMPTDQLDAELVKIGAIIERMVLQVNVAKEGQRLPHSASKELDDVGTTSRP